MTRSTTLDRQQALSKEVDLNKQELEMQKRKDEVSKSKRRSEKR